MRDANKLTKAYSAGAFGLPDLPQKMGLGRCAHLDHAEEFTVTTKGDRRSWKRHRKRRYRAK